VVVVDFQLIKILTEEYLISIIQENLACGVGIKDPNKCTLKAGFCFDIFSKDINDLIEKFTKIDRLSSLHRPFKDLITEGAKKFADESNCTFVGLYANNTYPCVSYNYLISDRYTIVMEVNLKEEKINKD
jgi:hypothetical protein